MNLIFLFVISSLLSLSVLSVLSASSTPKHNLGITLTDDSSFLKANRHIYFSDESALHLVAFLLQDYTRRMIIADKGWKPKSKKMKFEALINDLLAHIPSTVLVYPEEKVKVDIVEESSLSSTSANAVKINDHHYPVESLEQWRDRQIPGISINIDRKDIIGSATRAYKTTLSLESLSVFEGQKRNIQVEFNKIERTHRGYTDTFLAIFLHKMFHESNLFVVSRNNFISLPKIEKITPEILDKYEAFGYFLAKHIQTGQSIGYYLSFSIIDSIKYGNPFAFDELVSDSLHTQLLMISLGFHRGCPVHLFKNHSAVGLQELIRGNI